MARLHEPELSEKYIKREEKSEQHNLYPGGGHRGDCARLPSDDPSVGRHWIRLHAGLGSFM
jgi:hypothetical protein